MNTTPDFSNLLPYAASPDDTQILARFRAIAEQGGLRHALPAEFGGYGDGFADLRGTHRQLGLASRDPGLLLMVNAHLWGIVFPVRLYGSAAQQQQFLPKLIAGQWLGGHAITEPGCGSDVQAMISRAERAGENFILNGEKRYITNAPLADWLVVYAKLDGKITAFLVSWRDQGCRFSGEGGLEACRGGVTGSVLLDNCRVGADRLLGKAGAGTQMIQKALEYERAFVFAGIAGIMQWQLDEVVRHSRDRRSGGVHLGRHQAIGHRIADMKLRLDTVDLWLNECARLCDAGQRLTLASAQTKPMKEFLRKEVSRDDILDALVGLVVASTSDDALQTAPMDPEKDSGGLPMEMVFTEQPNTHAL
ncbi:acyl-CoA dehydrogenase family protein [Methylomonas rivi]|uniref:Acyl-CoA dehydrogenase family protein n=1 Tax=Methylomonas rivi TaxID=2952226 RepID=A0ABT1U957_9GAMM|nr:acyl-CoA dehydrogenase family protein [Methylomonas sp. WSC-6]MCQ8129905.1 acyl-CoA dehydrogenase family protein [Methylomonas sp. WSC-6]